MLSYLKQHLGSVSLSTGLHVAIVAALTLGLSFSGEPRYPIATEDPVAIEATVVDEELIRREMERLEQIRSIYGEKTRNEPCYNCGWSPGMPQTRAETQLHGEATRPTSYLEPQVHWSGNPPVWEKTPGNTSITEKQVRDLARRTLQELRDQEP